MPTVSLNVRIEKSVKGDLLDVCRRTHRPQSYCIEKALADFIAREKKSIRCVQEGIDAANRGEMIDDEEIDKWLSSWGTENELGHPEAIGTSLPLPRNSPAGGRS